MVARTPGVEREWALVQKKRRTSSLGHLGLGPTLYRKLTF
jgi:hypothetical protein